MIKRTKSTSLKGITAMMIVMAVIFFMPFASALDFFPTHSYDSNTKTATIYADILQLQKVADIQLLSNTDQCLIDCEAVIRLTPNQDINVDNNLDYKFNIKGRQGEDASSRLKGFETYKLVSENYTEDVPVYNLSCNNNTEMNGSISEQCNQNLIRTDHVQKSRQIWQKFNLNPSFFKKLDGSVDIKIIGKKSPTDSVDWIPRFYGVNVNEMAWWDSSWGYKQPINITESSGNSLSSYEVKLFVANSSHMNGDGSDLRFTNSSENAQLPYWIESMNSTTFTVWVKTESVVASSSASYIWMYYGNPSATSQSSLVNTFTFGDDFLGSSVNTTKWNIMAGFTTSISNGVLYINGSNDQSMLSYDAIPWNNTISEWKANVSGASIIRGYLWYSIVNTTTVSANYNGTITTGFQTDSGVQAMWNLPSTLLFQNTSDTYRPLTVLGISKSGTTVRFFKDYVLKTSNTSNLYFDDSSSAFLKIRNNNNQVLSKIAVDWLRVRKFVYPEPTASFGTEQNVGMVSKLISPANNANVSTRTNTFICNQTANGNALANNTLYIYNSTGSIILTNYSVVTGTTINQTSNIMTLPYDGTFTWNCLAGESTGGTTVFATSNYTLNIDSTPPVISMIYPVNSSWYSVNVSTLNYTYSDSHPDSCWYSRDGGVTNSTKAVAGVNFTSVTSVEGNNTWSLYCNDTLGNKNSTFVTFYKDTVKPLISFVYPSNNSILNYNNISVNYTSSDTNLQSCWWTYAGSSDNYSIPCGTNITGQTWSEGNHILTIWDNDTAGNVNSSSVTFLVDTTYPVLNITAPIDGQMIMLTGVNTSLNYSVSDTNLQSCWYNQDSVTNITLTSCANRSIIPVFGFHNLTVYANDTAGNMVYSNRTYVGVPVFAFCNATYNKSMVNFTFYDESTNSKVNATLNPVSMSSTFTLTYSGNSYDYSYSAVNATANHLDFCTNNVSYYFNNAIAPIQYSAVGYNIRNYYLANNALYANSSTMLNLYLVPSTSTALTVIVVDGNLVPQANITVKMQRYYPSTDLWQEVSSVVTDAVGHANFYVTPYDVNYNFILSNASTVLYSTNSMQIVCFANPCTLTLALPSEASDIFKNYLHNGIAYTLEYNNNTQIATYSFADSGGSTTGVRLYVRNQNLSGSSTVCNTSLAGSSGTINCNLTGNSSGTYFAQAYYTEGGSESILDRATITIDNTFRTFGNEGLIWSALFILESAMVALWNPAVGIGMVLIGLVALFMLGFTAISWMVLISIILLGGIVISQLKT